MTQRGATSQAMSEVENRDTSVF